MGRSVYPHDAEDLKAHRWFRDIPWDRLHLIPPPFVPQISSIEDTHYFDEEESISDWSDSIPDTDSEAEISRPDPMAGLDPNPLSMTAAGAIPAPPGALSSGSTYPARRACNMAEVNAVLATYPKPLRAMLAQSVATPYDSARLKRIHREIEHMALGPEQAARLKDFVQVYGLKERKRPRDRLLRDRRTRAVSLEIRKRSAFLGYAWRRMDRPELPGAAGQGLMGVGPVGTTGLGMGTATGMGVGALGITAMQLGIGGSGRCVSVAGDGCDFDQTAVDQDHAGG